jgi:hypothetical protein
MGLNFLYLFLCPFFTRISILHEKLHQTSDREHLTQDEFLVFHEQFLEVSLDHRSPLGIYIYLTYLLSARARPEEIVISEKDGQQLTVEKGFAKNFRNPEDRVHG